MKVSELTGAQLDYWVARAEGVPKHELTIRRVPRTHLLHVVRQFPSMAAGDGYKPPHATHAVLAYSTDWVQGGPLIEKWNIDLSRADDAWSASTLQLGGIAEEYDAATPLQAICRAVVRAAFGDEVDQVPAQPT